MTNLIQPYFVYLFFYLDWLIDWLDCKLYSYVHSAGVPWFHIATKKSIVSGFIIRLYIHHGSRPILPQGQFLPGQFCHNKRWLTQTWKNYGKKSIFWDPGKTLEPSFVCYLSPLHFLKTYRKSGKFWRHKKNLETIDGFCCTSFWF